MSKVLVVGGAGYVGSVACAWLKDAGHDVWVLDDLTTGHRELLLGRGFTLGKAGNPTLVSRLLKTEKFDCVMHFAARSLVSESREKPAEYFENNVNETRRLLDTMLSCGVRNFIFSSSCAIFGDSAGASINETAAKQPMSPYGENKLEVERILETLAREKGLRAIALRYFNAAGADPQLRVGEWHEKESHLIPRVLQAVIAGKEVEVYGADYPTPDGTCIRDYIHVWDLAGAHAAAMERLVSKGAEQQGVFEAYNLGSEKGFSVKEIIQCCEEVTGQKIQISQKDRRLGDAPRLVADSTLASKVLGFGPQLKGIREILSSAWDWEKKRLLFKKKAVFLDRDGTINDDPGYLNNPSQVKLLPGVGEALSLLKQAGYLLIVVSNQSGVGRGLIQLDSIPKIHKKLDELLAPWSVKIDDFCLCFHVPVDNCDCRKPKPKLILEVAAARNIDVSESYFVGDRISDLRAGTAAGCKAVVLVRTGDGMKTSLEIKEGDASHIADSLLHAVQWLLNREGISSSF
ncbi:MAG: UDP-glucose 4-epimerase GalE [Bdellovibrionia bacterium]